VLDAEIRKAKSCRAEGLGLLFNFLERGSTLAANFLPESFLRKIVRWAFGFPLFGVFVY